MNSLIRTKRCLASTGLAFVLIACGGEGQTPEALPLVDERNATTTTEAASTTSTSIGTTSSTAPLIGTSPTSVDTTTTTNAPPPVPTKPTLIVECATNPRTVTVTFDAPTGSPLDWELRVTRHPGGTGLDAIEDVLESGNEAPAEPLVHEILPNDLGFVVEAANSSGSAEAALGVQRYTSCPISGSLQARIVDQIDCVSGAFRFAPDANSDIEVDSVVVDRVGGADTELSVTPAGEYWVPGWRGPEEVKAIVTYSDSLGTYEEHINHWCFGGPFVGLDGEYKVCADEVVKIAYPGDWVSTIDLNGPEGTSCAFFRYGPEDGHVDHNVTLEKLGEMSLTQATADLLPPGPWIIANQDDQSGAFTDRIGTTAGGDRIRYELAWDSAPTLTRRVVWLIDVGGTVWRLETNIQGLQEIDGMAHSIQFVVQ